MLLLIFSISAARLAGSWHFAANSPTRVFGCDINPNNIAFIRSHLPGSIIGFQNTTIPPLPIPDNSVGLIYAGSVFTHIYEFEEAWLLEIRRILRQDGIAFVTFHSERTWNDIDENHFIYKFFTTSPHRMQKPDLTGGAFDGAVFKSPMPSDRVAFIGTDFAVNNANLFHSTDYVRRRWGRILEIRQIRPMVHGHHQDGAIMQKK